MAGLKDNVIKKNEMLVPFMGSKLSFITGQDPVGLLNISQQTFAMLIPGASNVTGRIRYYSFYCWFFGWYAKSIGSEDPKEFYKYLRRAEFVLALIGARNNANGATSEERAGVSGITKAEEFYGSDRSEYSLSEGTGESTGTTEGSYWKNRRGVFGQNYVSPMRQIGLIRDKGNDSGIYIRTAFDKENTITGKDLEEAFEENVSDTVKTQFLEAVKSGVISSNVLDDISTEFNMMQVPKGSLENKHLWSLLISTDYPTSENTNYFRRDTIKLYLESLSKNTTQLSVTDFVNKAYDNQGKVNGEVESTLMGWYYFQLSQFWHIVCASALSHFLNYLEQKAGDGWYEEHKLIDELVAETVLVLTEDFGANKEEFKGLKVPDLNNMALVQETHSKDAKQGLAYTFALLSVLVEQNRDIIDALRSYAKQYQISSPSEFTSVYNDLEQRMHDSLENFMSYFLKRYVLNRHQLVALHKMNNSQSTEKFLREDGYVRLIERIGFEFSSPRLGTLIAFCQDLNIISSDYDSITEDGLKIMKQLDS